MSSARSALATDWCSAVYHASHVFSGVGVAVSPQDWTNFEEYVVYLTLGVEEGGGETEFSGVALGLWNIAPTDLDGRSWGVEAVLGLVDEIVIEASFADRALTDFIGISIADGRVP